MKRLKNKIKINILKIEYTDNKPDYSLDGKYYEERILYTGEYTKEKVDIFTNDICNKTGWKYTRFVSTDELGNKYFHFNRPLQADEVERIYQFYSKDAIQGIPVWVGCVYDRKHGTEEQKQKLDRCHELGYHGTNMTVNEVQQQFNPEWLGYAMIGVEDEFKSRLIEILGYEPQPYNWIDTDRVPKLIDTTMLFRVDVERLPELITGTVVTMVEYDKTKIGTKEWFKDFPISEKSYYFDLNDVDMEAYEALKDYIRIELEEE